MSRSVEESSPLDLDDGEGRGVLHGIAPSAAARQIRHVRRAGRVVGVTFWRTDYVPAELF